MNKGSKSFLQKVISLSKITIMLPVALTAVTGFFLFDPSFSVKLLLIVSGVLLLAISASVLNQIQEIRYDAIMERTRSRPLTEKSLSLFSAWVVFASSLLTGSVLLYSGGGLYPLVTGLLTLVWYNGVYTYLKRITAFAIVPGALTGVLPLIIGYLGAGGELNNPEILSLSFVFFMAQIPHFWMILMRYGDEYLKAGLPSLTNIFDVNKIRRLTFIWVLASVVAFVLLPLFSIITSAIGILILLLLSLTIIAVFFTILIDRYRFPISFYFRFFNYYILFLLLLIIADKTILGM